MDRPKNDLTIFQYKSFTYKMIRILFFLILINFIIFSSFADVISDLNTKARNLNNEGKYQQALEIYDEVLKLNNNSTSSLFNKADTYNRMKNYNNSLTIFEQIISLEPQNIQAWNGKGNALRNLKRYDDAIQAFENISAINKSYAPPYKSIGDILQTQKKYEEALVEFDKAIKLDPKNLGLYSSKASTLSSMKKYLDAIAEYDKMIELNQSYYPAYSAKGDALRSLKLYQNALNIYNEGIKIYPDYLSLLLGKGSTLNSLGRHNEALETYDEAYKLNESHTSALSAKAGIFNQLKDYKNALETYDKVLTLDPNNTGIWKAKGNVLMTLENYPDAIKAFDKSIQLNQSDPYPWTAKGKALNKAGNYSEALDAFDKALTLNPEYSDAQKNRETLLNLFESCKSICVPQKCPENSINITPTPTIQENVSLWDSILGLILVNKKNQDIISEEKNCYNNVSPSLNKDIINDGNLLIINDKKFGLIQILDINGNIISEIQNTNTESDPIQEFTDVSLDDKENIYILDAILNKIFIFDSSGKYLRSWNLHDDNNKRVQKPEAITIISGPTSIIVIVDAEKSTLPMYDTNGKYLGDMVTKSNSGSNNGSLSKDHQNNSVPITYYQNIIPVQNSNPPTAERNFEIKNGDDIYSFSFTINRADYLGAQGQKIIERNYNNENPEEWVPVIQGMLNDPIYMNSIHQVYGELDKIRRDNQLTDGMFFDLITGFVQQIPLSKEENIRYPIEILHDKKAGSFDKAVFLYSLLYEAGYDVIFISYPNTDHYAVGIKSVNTGNPEVVSFYDNGGKNYFYINPENPSFTGDFNVETKTSDPFIFHVLPDDKDHIKCLPDSINRITILETMKKIGEKKQFLEENIKKLSKTVQRNPQKDLDKIKSVINFVESQPWNTEGVYLRLKNSKVADISLNYGIK